MDNIFTLVEEFNVFLREGKVPSSDLIEAFKENNTGGNLAIAQINTISGDLKYNAKKIAQYIKFANEISLDMVIFPELSLIGYPLEDALSKFPFIANESLKWIKALAKLTTNTVALVGFYEPIKGKCNKFYNSVAVLRNGKIDKIVRKEFVSRNEFTDSNYVEEYISNEDDSLVINVGKSKYTVLIGEELFKNKNLSYLSLANINDSNTIISIASSRFTKKNEIIKNSNLSNLAMSIKSPVIQVNQVGTMDCYSFAGYSCVYDSKGFLLTRANGYEEQLLVFNLSNHKGKIYDNNFVEHKCFNDENFSLDYSLDMERTYKTLVQGIRDYFNKCGISRAVLGLSGGLDSSVCAILLSDAIGRDNVYGISMPSHITSKESKSDARMLAENLGIHFAESSIKQMINTTSQCFDLLFSDIEIHWGKYWDNVNKCFSNEKSSTYQSFTMDNIQARSRAMYLWGIANEFSSCIPIATSDKSELYMGYATINGDMSGGFAPIADVTKTKLFALARWMNGNRTVKNVMPESIILKRPGAELAIDPNTGKPLIAEDALMPYEFLDEIIWRVENKKQSYNELLEEQFVYEKNNLLTSMQKKEWLDKFFRRMSSALYKWTILPPSIIVEDYSINRNVYKQLVTSSKIDYKSELTLKDIENIL